MIRILKERHYLGWFAIGVEEGDAFGVLWREPHEEITWFLDYRYSNLNGKKRWCHEEIQGEKNEVMTWFRNTCDLILDSTARVIGFTFQVVDGDGDVMTTSLNNDMSGCIHIRRG